MREIELKFLVDEAVTDRIISRLRAIGSGHRTRKLRSIYYDTAEHALKTDRVALRLRHDGRNWIQSVKAGSGPASGLSDAEEIENPSDNDVPDLCAISDQAMRSRLTRLVGRDALRPVCETLVERTSCDVDLGDGSRAQLAVDTGEIRANGHTAPIREIEIELIEGKIGQLFEFARRLFPRGGFRFSRYSKGARGYMLATEEYREPAPGPRRAQSVEIVAGQETQDAACAILRECVDQIGANLDFCQRSDEPEGPHQLRIGLRRLRTAFSVLAPAIGCAEMNRLAEEAKWLGQVAGSLRDLEVIRDDIIGPAVAEKRYAVDLKPSLQRARRLARAKRSAVIGELASGRAVAFLLDLARFVETRGWMAESEGERARQLVGPTGVLAGSALEQQWKKVRKRAANIAELDIDARHKLRKELKKIRYTVEFFAPLYPEENVKPFLSRLKKLQDQFGDLNDVATLEAHAGVLEGKARANPAVARALGYLIGFNRAYAEIRWTGAKSSWRDLKKTRPFWCY